MPDLFPEDLPELKTALAKAVYELTALKVEARDTARGYRETRARLEQKITELSATIHGMEN